ncbi:hypothetical protein CKO12_13660 [Chromatium okenii]|uniref:RHS repeat-associated core domain-containing protein n=1 Tax=Chromatium okenii TaxID=61644 RepID=UPI0019074DB3|nr:RHS repeat-associated core domain-containing protein [Chromatium okenii]MBK1642895.1 hypothetical protein [Chromatium okenii]
MLYLGDGSRRSAESNNSAIITTVAGTGVAGYSGDGGLATKAQLNQPIRITIGSEGSLYINDSSNNRLRRVSPDGIINTIAGNGILGDSGDGGLAINAKLYGGFGVAVTPDGVIYIAQDSYTSPFNRIRKIGKDGIISAFAGTGIPGYSGDGGSALLARMFSPSGLALGSDGSLYISISRNDAIRRVSPDGIITTVVGTGVHSYSGDKGPAIKATLGHPQEISFTSDGSLLITDGDNFRVRRVTTDGIINTVSGSGSRGYSGDGGPATSAAFNYVWGVASAQNGVFYVGDHANCRVRKVNSDGIVSTIAGNGICGYGGDGGPATQAMITQPDSLAVDKQGNLYIADRYNHAIRRVSASLPGISLTDLVIASKNGSEAYQFDSTGHHLRTRNTLTNQVISQFTYDTAGRLISITDADGNITTIERNTAGNPTAIVAPHGQRTVLTLDTNGYLASVKNPAGETYAMTYTADGLLTAFKNPNGHSSTMTYDALGRLIKDQNADGGSQNLVRTELPLGYEVTRTTGEGRNAKYRLETLTTGDQQSTNTDYDNTQITSLIKTDGTTKTTQPDGTQITLIEGPDPRFGMQIPIAKSLTTVTGGLTSTITTNRTATLANSNDPLSLKTLTDTMTVNSRTSTKVYDAATKRETSTSAAGRVGTETLDNLGRTIQSQITDLLAINNGYDTQGQLVSISQGTGVDQRNLTLAYNPQGDLKTLTDPLGRTLGYQYDAAGRITQKTLPDGRELRYAYDDNGNLTSLTPPGQLPHLFTYTKTDQTAEYSPPEIGAGTNSTVYTYNLDKDLTKITRPDGQLLRFTYDTAGRLSQQTLPNGTQTYSYNATTGKLTSVTDLSGGSIVLTYNGALLTKSNWTGAIAGNVGFGYDNDFRMTSISVNGANSVTYTYDADSLLTKAGALTLTRSSQNGLVTGSSLGLVTDAYSYNGFGETSRYDAKISGVSVFKTDFTYDKLGRITHKIETQGASVNNYDYGYDLAGRLVEVKRDDATISSYSYDDNGNRLLSPGLTASSTYDDQDRLLTYGNATYTYTANGELATKTVNGQTTTYDYDVLGNLRQVDLPDGRMIDYVIDAANRRVGKKINGTLLNGFLYQDGLKPIAELDSTGAVVSRFVYANHANVPDYMVKGGVTYRIVTDHLGSPRLVVNTTNGSVIQRMNYDEFGNVLTDSNPGFQPFGFAGGLYDRDTKLVRFGARDYDAEIGRWTAKDPIGFNGGDTNLYGYIINDPVNAVDYNGQIAPLLAYAGVVLMGGTVGAITNVIKEIGNINDPMRSAGLSTVVGTLDSSNIIRATSSAIVNEAISNSCSIKPFESSNKRQRLIDAAIRGFVGGAFATAMTAPFLGWGAGTVADGALFISGGAMGQVFENMLQLQFYWARHL